jgi:hypothetical protein
MLGVCSSSVKTNAFGADVAWLMRSAAARGDVADFERARKGSRALSARCCSMVLRVQRRLFSGEERGVTLLFPLFHGCRLCAWVAG